MVKLNLKNGLQNLKTKFRDSTSTGSFVMLLLMLIGLALFDKIFCPTNILFQITIIMTSFTLLFFGSKVWRAFFSQTKFNEKGIKVYERFAELRGEGFSVMEANCIVNNEVIQENSKHQKAIKKEAVYVFSMAIILIAMFTLKGVQLIEVVQ